MKKEYETLLNELLARKKEILKHESSHAQDRQTEVEPPHGDELDIAEQATEQEMLMTLRHRSSQELQSIDEAIEKMRSGQYGICENCDEEIDKNRLEARPFVKYCIDCQKEIEKREDEESGTAETYKFTASD